MIPVFLRVFALLRSDEEGQTLVEYALILLLVSTAAFTLLSLIGKFPQAVFTDVNGDF
jgi:Flp pilus assembly pilin Flp